VLDRQSGVSKSSVGTFDADKYDDNNTATNFTRGDFQGYGDIGGASKILHKIKYDELDHDLFIYEPKVDGTERNEGLDSYITFKYNGIKEIEQLCQEENMELVELLKRVIFGAVIKPFNIEKYGDSITVQCHKDNLFTILTEIRQITELKIYNSLVPLFIKGCTQIASCEMASGGNFVPNVENINELIKKTGIGQTKVSGLLILGVANAILKIWLLLKEKENWKDNSNFHCTLKPVDLNAKILKLFKTPNEQMICYPFAGSGSEILGGLQADYQNWVACEINQDYVDIANARIKHWKENKYVQLDLFETGDKRP
jgi:hypothetical protein